MPLPTTPGCGVGALVEAIRAGLAASGWFSLVAVRLPGSSLPAPGDRAPCAFVEPLSWTDSPDPVDSAHTMRTVAYQVLVSVHSPEATELLPWLDALALQVQPVLACLSFTVGGRVCQSRVVRTRFDPSARPPHARLSIEASARFEV